MARCKIDCAAVLLLSAALAPAQTMAQPADGDWIQDWLVLERSGRYGRSPIHVDPLQHALAMGTLPRPRVGEAVVALGGKERRWRVVQAGEDGWLPADGLAGSYAWTTVHADHDRSVLLDAAGHGMVYVNGEPRGGNPYDQPWLSVPVRLSAGENTLLFHCSRGLRARLLPMVATVMLDHRDVLVPDVVVGQHGELWGGVPVINGTSESHEDLHIEAAVPDGRTSRRALPRLAPCSTRKVPFRLPLPASAEPGDLPLTLRLLSGEGGEHRVLHSIELTLRVRRPEQSHKRTFISSIDGSVQYYAVQPARSQPGPEGQALFLSLHGASVEAIRQASAYAPKDEGVVVAPTNRRPYGFDWEDWGRWDALEVLERAMAERPIDPERVYLTGHSMGGHGTWQLGVSFPQRFAAIGPSAAWISFWSYTGAERFEGATGLESMLRRAANPSDTLALVRNLEHLGVYVLHGDQDDNVPVEQSRRMREVLAGFHADFAYYERPGAGHWWGDACMDWPAMFDFFRRHRLRRADGVRDIDFRTASPGVSATHYWATIEMQERPLEISTLQLSCDCAAGRISGVTDNVARLALDLALLGCDAATDSGAAPGGISVVELDGQSVTVPADVDQGSRLLLRRAQGTWAAVGPAPPGWKNPRRYGPFKDVFRNRFVLVHGTAGSDAENRWALHKARFDAETFLYRGNGNVEILPDNAFVAGEHAGRNVVLYGNADTNAAWPLLLADSPVQVRRGALTVGDRELRGADLGVLLVRPHPRDHDALVAVVGGSGLAGMSVTDRLPYFVSGVAYPDCMVLRSAALLQGSGGVEAAGFFGEDWSVESGDFVWSDTVGAP